MKLTPDLMIQLMERRPKRIGEILVDQGLLSEEDLDTALVTRAALKGYLERACGEESVNHINAPRRVMNDT